MAPNTLAGATALKTIAEGLSGVGDVQLGQSVRSAKAVDVAITMASQTKRRKVAGVTERDARYFVLFAYRVDGDEDGAEIVLMNLVDAFIEAIDGDLTLGGVCQDVTMDMGLADTPDYVMRTGKEFREYPILVTLKQYGTYNVNP